MTHRLGPVDRRIDQTRRRDLQTQRPDKTGASRWISEPARKHGLSDVDTLHAVRNAMRRVELDDDLTMLIEAGTNGARREIAVLDIDGDDPAAIRAMPPKQSCAHQAWFASDSRGRGVWRGLRPLPEQRTWGP